MPPQRFKIDATSRVKDDVLQAYLRTPMVEELQSIPQLGAKTEEKMIAAGVTTTYQLLGKFLSMRAKGMRTQEHCDLFVQWLDDIGVAGQKHSITLCLAEKANQTMPGIFVAAELD